jgi:hypothetical protein
MSKDGDEGKVPQQQFDEDDNQVVSDDSSKSETSKPQTLEYLMKKLEKLKVENKRLRSHEEASKAQDREQEAKSKRQESHNILVLKQRRRLQ